MLKNKQLFILLDFDGVLITTPPWRKVELLKDGFMEFNENAANNLAFVLKETSASIVLTTTHRIRFNVEEWIEIFKVRGVATNKILKINDVKLISEMRSREIEIKEWVALQEPNVDYIIIDDDQSLHDLPLYIKDNWVSTSSMIGLDTSSVNKVIQIANGLSNKKGFSN